MAQELTRDELKRMLKDSYDKGKNEGLNQLNKLRGQRSDLAGIVVTNSIGYHSKIRFGVTQTDDNFIMAAGKKVAFSYGLNKEMQSAGFPAGQLATLAETNLVEGSKTRSGETFYISAIGAVVDTTSEIMFTKEIIRRCTVEVTLDATTKLPLGRIESFTKIEGLWSSRLKNPPPLDASFDYESIGQSNGPSTQRLWVFDEPLVWTAYDRDNQFELVVELPGELIIAAPARAAAAGVAPYDPPNPDDVFVEITWNLYGVSSAKQSVNQQ